MFRLCSFFRHIQPSIRLFEKEKFFRQYTAGMISRSLLLTLLFLTTKILGSYEFWNGSHVVNDCLRKLLDADSIEQQRLDHPMALDDFRQSVLLTYYTFHEFPGERAWMKVSMLTRKALQYGLHQIDNHENLSMLQTHSMDPDEVEDWRYVWWCIYCLDSYSNITSATPFIIEAESIKTALITPSTSTAGSNRPDPTEDLLFLPADNDLLWKTVKDLSRDTSSLNFNMHIVSTKILKEAATIRRLRFQNASDSLQARALLLEDHLCVVRLALPAKYFYESRNVSQQESKLDHHSRLICLIHIHAARLILCISVGPGENEKEWLRSWQQSLQYCEDIVSTTKQWDAQFCSSVDPAICFVIYAVLVIIYLHRICELTEPDLHPRLETYKNMLVLFLQQFGSSWKLPQTLISSFECLTHRFPGPQTPKQVRMILNQLQGPRDPKWLHFLSLRPDPDDTRAINDYFQTMFPEVLPLYDWATSTSFSS
ncbi:hypothetical protein BDV26DRAFT_197895 [Aspergillus bertholletiae]|uniref:Xylanolytic transcriptional activator regulatory domain-containing protein n=1 Tax=Aspergillus bertholletiae TaxID=1226010 RepID=A0A5N7B8U2_9EURO|nr:hypothetical protein BDV26DRAFT_197895 [Aspergillus bertholletiae]